LNLDQLRGSLDRASLASTGVIYRTGPFLVHLRSSWLPLFHALCDLYPETRAFGGQHPRPGEIGRIGRPSGGQIVDFRLRMLRPRGIRGLVRPQIRFSIDAISPFEPYPLHHAFPLLEWGTNWCIAMRAHQYLMLHAGVVERGGRGLILAGVPGSGKSTLTAALAWRGWRLLSDEFGLVRRPEGDLFPLPRAIPLKNESIEVIRAFAPEAYLGPRYSKTRKGDVSHMRPPPDSLVRQQEPAKPCWIVFPRFRKGSRARLEPIADGLAFTRLAHNCFNYRMLGETGFRALTALIRRCECYNFEYGDLDTATAVLGRLDESDARAIVPAARQARGPRNACPPGGEALHGGNSSCLLPRGAEPVAAGRLELGRSAGAHLIRALEDPAVLRRFSVAQWDLLLREARAAKLLGSLAYLVQDLRLETCCPQAALDILEAARHYPAHLQTRARVEIREIRRALAPARYDLILLKGAAYAAARLPLARGRLMADADIMVRHRDLPRIEQQLLAGGWKPVPLDRYDQRYYREWMHEIPPLKHPARAFEVDIHHALLPLTARVRPDPELLWEASVPLDDGLRVLAPTDMFLHAAAHLFYGEFDGGLRELLDLHRMLGHFGPAAGFWDDLPARAARLELARALFYALRYCRLLFGSDIPQRVLDQAAHLGAPSATARALMDILVPAALIPRWAGQGLVPGSQRSVWLLYLRSHWLRMPPALLAAHLARKALGHFTASRV